MPKLAALLAVLAIVVACTGDDDAAPTATTGATVPASSTQLATTEVTATNAVAPASTSPLPSPTTTSPPPIAHAVAIELPRDRLGGAGAVELLPAHAGRGHLLIGWQQTVGQPPQPRVWESTDGLHWTAAAAAAAPTPPDADTRFTVGGAAWLGEHLAIVGGSGPTDTATRAAVWLVPSAGSFDEPPERPIGDRPSAATAVAVTDGGLVVAGWVEDAAADSTFVTVRGPDGTWSPATVPDLPYFSAAGVASIGSTLVVTGTDGATEPSQARALVSTDAGATFEVADTTSLLGGVGSGLGEVGVTSAGFVAAACAASALGNETALARSADGVTWSRQDITIVGDDEAVEGLSLRGGGCAELTVRDDTVHVGVHDITGWALAVDGDGVASAQEVPRRSHTIATAEPMILPTAAGLTVVGREVGGLLPAELPSGAIGSGLPQQRPYVAGLELTDLVGSTVLQVTLFPEVTESLDGSYEWQSYDRWFNSADGRSFARALAIPESFYLVEQLPFGAVGLVAADDPADDDAAGPRAGTEAYGQAPDGAWQSLGLISSGPGGEQLSDLAAVGAGAVGVGDARRRDPVTNVESVAPLVKATDGTTWVDEAIPLPPGAFGGLASVCTIGEVAVAYGWQLLDGVGTSIVAVRDPSGSWSVTVPAGIPGTTGLGDCTSDGTRILLIGSGLDRSTVWVSGDGVNFTAADLSDPGFADSSFADIQPIAGRLLAVGAIAPEDEDARAALWISSDGLSWTEVPVEGLDGPGPQSAVSVTSAPDGSIAVAGYDNSAPVVWNVPAAALGR